MVPEIGEGGPPAAYASAMPTSWARRVDPVVQDWWPVVLVLALSQIPAGRTGMLHPVVLTGLALLAAVPLRWRREWPAVVVAVVAIAPGVHVALTGADPPFASFAALLIASVALGQHAGVRWSVVGLVAVVAALTTVFVLGPPAPVADLAIPVVYFGGAWAIGRILRRRHETAERMAGLVVALEQERDAKARLAAEAERQHIAREVHDVVAHSLGVIAIHSEAAEELLERGSGDVREPLGVIRDTARHALDELRGVLGTIRADEPSPLTTLAAIPDLVRRFDGSGVAVTVDMADVDADRPLPSPVEATVYRLVQEALTNAARHAAGAAVDVVVRLDGAAVHVAVHDDGAGGEDRRPQTVGGGHGLAGMRERVARLGGTFSAGAVDGGGFGVEAHLPLTGAAG